MKRSTITTAVTTSIFLLTGVSLAVDESGTILEVVLQLTIPVLALLYKATDKDGDFIPDFFQKDKP
jgi:hypothetical protein